MLQRILTSALVSLALVIAGCGGDDGSRLPDLGLECTVEQSNEAVYSIMQEWYYWYEELPDVDPADYASPEALLDAIRYEPLDTTFTYLTTVEEEEAFLSNAAYIGYGFSSMVSGTQLFLRESFEGGPAYEAGMRRGDEITAIDGVSVAVLIQNNEIGDAFGPREIGYTQELDVRHPDDTTDTYTISKAEVTTPIVHDVVTDLTAAGNTSYLFFRSFVNPAYDALDDAFRQISDAGDTRLVLDLRYNGGGLVDVAEHLGGLIAGNDSGGEQLGVMQFNDKHQERNVTLLIEALQNSADIAELVVITTGSTASASEMLINGLKPHMNIATIGSDSFGKPVGQSRFEFCETEILRPVTFKIVNADGEGDYFDGIPPTCAAEDDVLNQLGDTDEASLAEALYYLENGGTCSPATSVKASIEMARKQALQPEPHPLVTDGWDVLTGGAQ